MDDFEKLMRRRISRGSQGIGKKRPRIVRTPYDFCKGYHEKKQYTGVDPRKIRRYFMTSDNVIIPTVEELRQLEPAEATKLLSSVREKADNKTIGTAWGLKPWQVNKVFHEFKVIDTRRTAVKKPPLPAVPLPQFTMQLGGVFRGDAAKERLLVFAHTLQPETNYKITVTVEEV